MRFFPLLMMTGLILLTLGLFFVFDAFPTLDRPTSFAVLSFLSFGAILLILTDGIRRAKSGTGVIWSYIALAGTLFVTMFTISIWIIGEMAS
ncbi:hypothetical protein [Exiguobacterium sp. AM39-5BH]|uniref:hypothetical protein n=1 Tax=Exiguobacterium sp. AM39-5BH TaxID=2292355 RepID=UPI000FE1B2A9|nr:hypothetical protein [Exiguobacterium sp. AM39-5BH]RHB50590.1 hypothetical protein DW881_05455 [Exiguobacterium sp. AM39-5BH]